MNEKLKDISRMVYEYTWNINKKIEITKTSQLVILELKSTVPDIKIH